ncbi:MAG: S9 family peptidase, partial [Planctomycetes bacterium]|nr:S9 family peptidase [Planctomycetota bacterium]
MNRILTTAVACLCLVNVTRAEQAVPKYTAKQFYETTAVSGASFSADESRILFSSDATGIFNVYSIPVGGGTPTQLTNSKQEAFRSVSFFPKDDRFLYTADQGGNELSHLFVQETNGQARDLTPGDKTKAQFVDWAGDLQSFYVLTNERDARYFDLYQYQVDGYARKTIFQNDGGFNVADVSRDGRWLAMSKVRNNSDSNVYVLDLRAAQPEPILVTPHEGQVFHTVATFTPDSRELYYKSNAGREFDALRSCPLAQAGQKSAEHAVVEQAAW